MKLGQNEMRFPSRLFYIYPFNARGLRSSANVEEEKRVEIFI